jgi:hypothetical protein
MNMKKTKKKNGFNGPSNINEIRWSKRGARKKQSQYLKDRFKYDKKFRERVVKKTRKRAKDPDYIEKLKKAARKKWRNPEYRAKIVKALSGKRGSERMQKRWDKDKANGGKDRRRISRMMSKLHRDPVYAKRKNKINRDPKHRKQISRRVKKLWKNKEYRNQICRTKREAWANGTRKLHGAFHQGSRYRACYVGNGKRIWMRSSWEVTVAKWLDKNKIKWEYESKRFIVGKGRWKQSYTPDFYIPKANVNVEVKGYAGKGFWKKVVKFHKTHLDERLIIIDKKAKINEMRRQLKAA